ncbi:HEAT repeat domain-containing protein [Candidatus Synechococcus calcipolaris G9]|uniref:HEAT repeat domain-containing protein n=1 Tax=Candidatus Synechococcus calcipolaris G9 TaxID=1497997 RepID=A0ABT6F209_9SYNE|nr:HEAT repeat domain-containing protein [Candidatus Synechococcus calcipolaris]MDG2991899.1 HEAT repeat domain-containing protein [Candidatus Synechococcus calcipolaris G9]
MTTAATTVAAAITAVDQADSPESLSSAVKALADLVYPESIPTLIRVLGYNNPGAALAAVQGLINLGDCAVAPVLAALDEYNYGARAYSIRVLGAIGHPQSLDLLLQAALTDFAPSVRRAAIKGLGHLRWQELSDREAVAAQTQVLNAFSQLIQESDWSLRYAVVVALAELLVFTMNGSTVSGPLAAEILARLKQISQADVDIAVRARAQLALQPFQAVSPVSMRPL